MKRELILFVLGCMDLDVAFAIPLKAIVANLPAALNTTTTSKKTYWHVHVVEANGGYAIPLHQGKQLSLNEYQVSIKQM